MLSILAIEDLMEQSIPGEVVYGFMGFVTVLSLVTMTQEGKVNLVVLVVVFSVMVLLHFVFKAVGLGDIWLIVSLYLGLGYRTATAVVIVGWLFMGMTALVLLSLRKMKRKATLPYLPFLYGAYVVLAVLAWL